MSFAQSLVILKKKGQEGMSVPISRDSSEEIVFGRNEACNICIKKDSVSMQHARIFFDNEGRVSGSPSTQSKHRISRNSKNSKNRFSKKMLTASFF